MHRGPNAAQQQHASGNGAAPAQAAQHSTLSQCEQLPAGQEQNELHGQQQQQQQGSQQAGAQQVTAQQQQSGPQPAVQLFRQHREGMPREGVAVLKVGPSRLAMQVC
jgi:hypothetical protein